MLQSKASRVAWNTSYVSTHRSDSTIASDMTQLLMQVLPQTLPAFFLVLNITVALKTSAQCGPARYGSRGASVPSSRSLQAPCLHHMRSYGRS